MPNGARDFRITFSRSAAKELAALDPRPPGCLKLTGSDNDWRIRVGGWRVLYTISDRAGIVDIAAVRHRSDAYR